MARIDPGAQPPLFSDEADARSFLSRREDQWFDRKSVRVKSKDLAQAMIALANADGGTICVGISDGKIEGVDSQGDRVNELRQAAMDHSDPTVRQSVRLVPCVSESRQNDHLLVFDIEASERVHRTKGGECYLRVGDETRRLSLSEEQELSYDKGESQFDRTLVPDLSMGDLQEDALREYGERLGTTDLERLLIARGLYLRNEKREGVTQAGLLLLGKSPPVHSYLRYIRHLGTTIETGTRSNVVEDIRLDGTIPELIAKARVLLATKIGTVERLGPDGRFRAVPLLPEFTWLEAIVNALTHRSYSIQGDGVRVRDFEDRVVVESPGRLPGLVRVHNIQNHRYSRNPHIARALGEMTGYVRELNEGVKRMFDEMRAYGLRPPLFEDSEGQLRVTLFKRPDESGSLEERSFDHTLSTLSAKLGEDRMELLLSALREGRQLRSSDLGALLGVSQPTARSYMRDLESVGLAKQILRSSTDPTRYWTLTEHPFWARRT